MVRPITYADDLDALGAIVSAAYKRRSGRPVEPGYEALVADVAGRLETKTIFGAFSDRRPLGCVTFIADSSDPHAENLRADETSFRMLAVAPRSQGRGVGTALVSRCLVATRAAGKAATFIYSGDWMSDAHRLYLRLGFTRTPDRDWLVDDPPVTLLGFAHDLGGTEWPT